MASIHHAQPELQPRRDCLGFTCMKWSSSGELSDLDLDRVLERLASVDPNLSVMRTGSLSEENS